MALHFMTEQRKKTATLNLRINPELKLMAEKAAASDQRSLTSLIEKLLTEWLKANGYLPK
jgi:predicted HicB family RNase H-like nuclease